MNIDENIKRHLLQSAASKHWKKAGIKRRAGVLFPLFSINTRNNMGIGEFPDLKFLIDWCVLTGHSVIQLLPINDTGPSNCPYSAYSAFAINPVYLSPTIMDGFKSTRELKKIILEIKKSKKIQKKINYSYIYSSKMKLFNLIFDEFNREANKRLINDFSSYCEKNKKWLDYYSLFMTIKEKSDWKEWELWEYGLRELIPEIISLFKEKNYKRIKFYSYLQWQSEKQMLESHKYSMKKGVLIKGDIPFLVGRDSADVWANRYLFNVDTSAGAPPDMFSDKGQKWGGPTFNWDQMSKDGYAWYVLRLNQAEKFYDLYRIDHSLGLYRIYTINIDQKDGSNGRFVPADETVWESHGEKLIKMMLRVSTMLPIAEDLGVVPDCVRPNLRKLGVPRTIVERWEKDYNNSNIFVDLCKVDPISMVTISTHDTETLCEWWMYSIDERDKYYSDTLKFNGVPDKFLSNKIHDKILDRNYSSNSLFVINLPQDIFRCGINVDIPESFRINIPCTVSENNWSFIFPIMVDKLAKNSNKEIRKENKRLRDLMQKTGRI